MDEQKLKQLELYLRYLKARKRAISNELTEINQQIEELKNLLTQPAKAEDGR